MEKSKIILKKFWGYDDFRPPQGDIIQNVLQGKDTVALLPTGGGKSICFQVPSLIFKGKTLVISPLIALMQDQVDNLFLRGIAAKSLNSNLDYRTIDVILDNFVFGDLKILYISPERLSSDTFMKRIVRAEVDLIAVDEAHCISQWGYDFRPAYFDIPSLRKIFPKAAMMALTATATPAVIEDIVQKLEMKSPAIFRKSFARKNLSLTVIHIENKKKELLHILSRNKASTIIYVRNRRETIEVAQWLAQYDIPCTSYHGGMEKSVRNKNQQTWMSNRVRIIVSTNAFGMGIDKPDVRYVIHLDVPPSIEEYYQEAGRAGRDGKNSFAVTLINESDIQRARDNLEAGFPSLELIATTYDRLCRFLKVAYGSGMMETYDFDFYQFSQHTDIPTKKLYFILNILEKEGWVTFSDGFRTPSRVRVLANNEDLYFMQRQRDMKNDILTYLLRHYEGLFMDYIKIDEVRMARHLNIDESKLHYYLNIMHAEGIIGFVPRTSAPQITFTRERPVLDDFYIDRKAYKNRKMMAEKRLQAMIQYMTQEDICRQVNISSYFGERERACGKCDICLGAPENVMTIEEEAKVRIHLKNLTQTHTVTIKDYTQLYPFHMRRRILKLLKDWTDENVIHVDNFGVIRVSGL